MNDVELKQVVKEIMQFGPNRVMVSANETLTCSKAWSEYHIGPDVIFIREDGWSLGAPDNLSENAERLYNEGWAGVLIKDSSEPISYETYCTLKSNK